MQAECISKHFSLQQRLNEGFNVQNERKCRILEIENGVGQSWQTPPLLKTNNRDLCRKKATDMHRMISILYTEITDAHRQKNLSHYEMKYVAPDQGGAFHRVFDARYTNSVWEVWTRYILDQVENRYYADYSSCGFDQNTVSMPEYTGRIDHQRQVWIHHVYRVHPWEVQSVFPHLDTVTRIVGIAVHQQDAYWILDIDTGVKSTPALKSHSRDRLKDCHNLKEHDHVHTEKYSRVRFHSHHRSFRVWYSNDYNRLSEQIPVVPPFGYRKRVSNNYSFSGFSVSSSQTEQKRVADPGWVLTHQGSLGTACRTLRSITSTNEYDR